MELLLTLVPNWNHRKSLLRKYLSKSDLRKGLGNDATSLVFKPNCLSCLAFQDQ